jgi:hypothetical protein
MEKQNLRIGTEYATQDALLMDITAEINRVSANGVHTLRSQIDLNGPQAALFIVAKYLGDPIWVYGGQFIDEEYYTRVMFQAKQTDQGAWKLTNWHSPNA